MTPSSESANELYEGLPDAIKKELANHEERVTVGQGARLLEIGAVPDRLIILYEGRAETTVEIGGKYVSLGVAGPGKVFALHSIMAGGRADTAVTCLEECRVALIPRKGFLDILTRNPQMYAAVLRVLSSDLATADRVIRETAGGVALKPAKQSVPDHELPGK
jgi:CRP/FNR family transcriptional regulator, dissimilatory nitrate respiration regulator